MEIGPGPGPEPEQPVTQDFTVSATGLVSRTFSLWIRQIFAYIILVGVVQLIYQVAVYAVLSVLFGTYADAISMYMATDPISFVFSLFAISTEIQFGTWPSAVDVSFAVGSLFVFMIIGTIIYAIVAGAAIKHALDDYGSRSADIGTSFSHAANRAFTLIFAQLIVSLIATAAILPGLALIIFSLLTLNFSLMLSSFGLILVGLLVLLYLTVRLAPTSAVVIAEDRSAIDSIKRAYSLTKGNFLHIFGGWILLFIAIFIVGLVIGLVLGPLYIFGGILGFIITTGITSLLLGPLGYIFDAVLYKDLVSRSSTEPQDWW